MSGPRCTGCYDSFSGPWCDNCDQWPCVCPAARAAAPPVEPDDKYGPIDNRPWDAVPPPDPVAGLREAWMDALLSYDPPDPIPARDELIEWNRRMLHGQEPDFTMLVDRVRREAASKAVAEVLLRREDLEWLAWFARKHKGKAADVVQFALDQYPPLRAALIASERKP